MLDQALKDGGEEAEICDNESAVMEDIPASMLFEEGEELLRTRELICLAEVRFRAD
jgi:hypothetical protein